MLSLHPTASGGILYDPSQISKPSDELFEPGYWKARNAAAATPGGRGEVLFIRQGGYRWVLRHYRRGGLVAQLSRDAYLWRGAEATRSFRELRLLAAMRALALPVPAPVAARFVRTGFTYRADLLTVELPASRTLAASLADALPLPRWSDVGRTIARFHAAGIQHADLNAHNVLLATEGEVYVLDFDRGCMRSPGSWEQSVLERLHRSLVKVAHQKGGLFGEAQWQALMSAYQQGR